MNRKHEGHDVGTHACPTKGAKRVKVRAVLVMAALALAGCRQDMHDAPRYEPLERSTFYADGLSARQLVAVGAS